jgi:hypothetical protein
LACAGAPRVPPPHHEYDVATARAKHRRYE